MTYDPPGRGDPPGRLRRDHGRNVRGRDSGGLGTRAALALAAVLLVAGLLATGVLPGSGTQRSVGAGPSASPAGLAAGPGATSGGPVASAGAGAPPASGAPGSSAGGGPAQNGSPGPSAAASPDPGSTQGPPGTSIPTGSLQAKLDAARARLRIPGVTVAILWDDGREWLGAPGLRGVAASEPMTTGTAVGLASVSKTLTAAVTLQLVDEGKLALDEPVAPLLPDYGLDKRITLRMLLDHTSGLPDYFLNARIDRPLQRAPDATWSAAETWPFVPVKHRPPGRRWIYSNTNYLLLGELVGRVTGRPIAVEI